VLNRFLFGSRTVDSEAGESQASPIEETAVVARENTELSPGLSELAATDTVDPAV
jgi:hypothetical protein